MNNIEKGMKVKVQSFLKKFHDTNSLRGGVSMETISSSMGWHQDFLKSVIKALIDEKQIRKVNDQYSLSSNPKQSFSKLQIKQIKYLEDYIKNSGLVPIEKTSIMKIKKYKSSEISGYNSFFKNPKIKSKILITNF